MSRKMMIAGVLALVALLAVLWWPKANEGVESGRSGTPEQGPVAEGERAEPRRLPAVRMRSGKATPGLGTVAGVVVDGVTGLGVSGVDVALLGARGETTVSTLADGEFSADLVPGTYTARVDADDVVSLAEPPFRVGRSLRTIRIKVLKLSTVSGTVVDASGGGVSDAEIVATSSLGRRTFKAEDLGTAGFASTSGDGSFSIRVAPGEVELKAKKGQKEGSSWLSGLAPGTQIDNVLISLAAGVSVAGRVEDSQGSPLVGATVQLTVYVENKYENFLAKSDRSGEFEVEGIPPGTLIIEAWKEGHGATVKSTYLPLAEGESNSSLVLVVSGPAAITGTVVGAGGKPLPGARVAAIADGSRRPRRWYVAGPDGGFVLDDLGPGSHTLYVGKDGYPDVSKTVTAPANVSITLVQGGAIRGTVVSTNGEPIPSFSVHVERLRSSLTGRSKTMKGGGELAGSGGSFVMDVYHPGSYVLLISAPGYGSKRLQAEVPVDQDANIEVRLAKSGVVVGTVKSGGRGVAGARVSMLQGYSGVPVFSGASGEFRLANVSPGPRLLSVSKQGYATQFIEDIAVESDKQARVDVVLTEIKNNSENVGIGVEWSEMADHPVVYAVAKGSGAAKVGLLRDDFVLGIDGIPTYRMSRTSARERVKGPPGSSVRLEIERKGRRFAVMVTRGRGPAH